MSGTAGEASGKCAWCGMFHEGVCPKARRIDYYPDGTVKSVEFWPVHEVAGLSPFMPFIVGGPIA